MVRMSAAEAKKAARIDWEKVAATTEAEIEQHALEDQSTIDLSKLKPRNRKAWPSVEVATAWISKAGQIPPSAAAAATKHAEIVNLSAVAEVQRAIKIGIEATAHYRVHLIESNYELRSLLASLTRLDGATMPFAMNQLAEKCEETIYTLSE